MGGEKEFLIGKVCEEGGEEKDGCVGGDEGKDEKEEEKFLE